MVHLCTQWNTSGTAVTRDALSLLVYPLTVVCAGAHLRDDTEAPQHPSPECTARPTLVEVSQCACKPVVSLAVKGNAFGAAQA